MYGKVFESIYTGSLHGKVEACCMMKAMIVLADEDGFIDMTTAAIIGHLGWPREFVLKGMSELMQPDEISRTEGEDGRRILPVTPCHSPSPENVNGWVLVNHSHYRELANREEKRSNNRERQRRSRESRNKAPKKQGKNSTKSADVTDCHSLSHDVTKSVPSEADTDTEAKAKKKSRAQRFSSFWEQYPRRNGIRKERKKAEAEFAKLSEDDAELAIKAASAYGDSGELPKDAFRWLKGDWQEWLAGEVYVPPKPEDDPKFNTEAAVAARLETQKHKDGREEAKRRRAAIRAREASESKSTQDQLRNLANAESKTEC